jgi:hypothetical protein
MSTRAVAEIFGQLTARRDGKLADMAAAFPAKI